MHGKPQIGLPVPGVAVEFRPEFIDFKRGIRVGNLNDNERITQILKPALQSRYNQPFVTRRWGRGTFWRWIGYLPRANRTAKPISGHVSFGCSKFFLMVDTEEQLFKCGLQVERGYLKAPRNYPQCKLRSDWDWHRLLKILKPKGLIEPELKRLVLREGFSVHAGSLGGKATRFTKTNFPDMGKLRRVLRSGPEDRWAGFQIYYAMREKEVRSMTGIEVVESILAIFHEVRLIMNSCMQIQLYEV